MERVNIENKVYEKITRSKKGTIFFAELFFGMGKPETVNRALSRLKEKGVLVRLAQGIYLYPRIDKELGVLYSSVETIAKVIAKRDKARIIPTGVYALNRLGLSTQIPMKVVFLTDGAARSIQIGKQSIKFKKTVPKNLSTKGEISTLVIQALREIGKGNVSQERLARINELLGKEDVKNIIHDARLAPVWISNVMLAAIKNTQEL